MHFSLIERSINSIYDANISYLLFLVVVAYPKLTCRFGQFD